MATVKNPGSRFRLRSPSLPDAPELDEQKALFKMVGLHQHLCPALKACFAIPNGLFTPSSRTAADFVAAGLRAGVPDLFCAVPRGGYSGLFIEMKRRRKGRVSQDQTDWIALLRAHGYRVEVCKTWLPAWNALCDYLGIESRKVT